MLKNSTLKNCGADVSRLVIPWPPSTNRKPHVQAVPTGEVRVRNNHFPPHGTSQSRLAWKPQIRGNTRSFNGSHQSLAGGLQHVKRQPRAIPPHLLYIHKLKISYLPSASIRSFSAFGQVTQVSPAVEKGVIVQLASWSRSYWKQKRGLPSLERWEILISDKQSQAKQ